MKSRLVGIAGPSCSGKTELARWLSRNTGAPMLNLDHYYIDMAELPIEVRARRNFDEPAALESSLILTHARELAAGRSITAPRYDFATHTRAPGGDVIAASPVVILEGLFALYWPELREQLSLKLFVDTPDDVCFARRLYRDVRERGRTEESVRWQFEETVKPMAHLHILPTRSSADLVVSGTDPVDVTGPRVLEMLQQPL